MKFKDMKIWIDLEKYRGMWLALDENEDVVSFDKQAKTAYKDAISKGVRVPILFKAPTISAPYIGSV